MFRLTVDDSFKESRWLLAQDDKEVEAPGPGKMIEVLVAEGAEVMVGDEVCVIETV
jgi:biotin carboxyl carrier protein